MHIISRKKLLEDGKRLGCEKQLDAWFQVARKAEWKSLDEVRKTYPSADGVKVGAGVYTVFNVAGNKFRLIVKIQYQSQMIFIKHVLTHAEYDKEDWKK